MKSCRFFPVEWIFFILTLFSNAFASEIHLDLSRVPEHGFVVCPVEMTAAKHWLGDEGHDFPLFDIFWNDKKIDAEIVHALFPLADVGNTYLFVAKLPPEIPRDKPCRLKMVPRKETNADVNGTILFPPSLKAGATIEFSEPGKPGGLPARIVFPDEKFLESLEWHDRLYDPEKGSWNVVDSASTGLALPKRFAKYARNVGYQIKLARPDGSTPSTKPVVDYQWFSFPESPIPELVFIAVQAKQETPVSWKEKHFLELHIPDGSFPKYFGDSMKEPERFSGTKKSTTFQRYAAFLDDAGNMIASITPKTNVYDGLGSFGPYLLPRGNSSWDPWTETDFRTSAWLWIGTTKDPVKSLEDAEKFIRSMPQAVIVIPKLDAMAKDWKTAAVNDLFLSGKIKTKVELESMQKTGQYPGNWFFIEYVAPACYEEGEAPKSALGLVLEKTVDNEKGAGLRLLSMVDKRTNTVLSSRKQVPLFETTVLDKETKKTYTITSESGWKEIDNHDTQCFFFRAPKSVPEGTELTVLLRNFPDQDTGGLHWIWTPWKISDRYEVRAVSFPQISIRNTGHEMRAVYPHASGVERKDPCGTELRWKGTYPSGWCSMQWTAAYDAVKNVGLYLGSDDAVGNLKDIRIETDAVTDSLIIKYDHPFPIHEDKRRDISVRVVWQPLHGDWFDASMIYRDFVRKKAMWYPRKKYDKDGRTDTPPWMKELCVWAMCGDSPQKMPEAMKKFTESLGVPTAVHWYNWHQIPFDNDYPHYFPAKDGFKDAVAEIQKDGNCFVMPYINGRLWDTRDKETEDFQFTSVALPGVAKKEDGTPYTESYGSTEKDGSKVELAVMCPASNVWKNKVTENISKLMNDCGVKGVYVDQIAAATPVLCFDKSHGHPLAGGGWWNRAYWEMFDKIRAEMPQDRMLTTECNGEPFINIFDGYLTWHWQYQDQIPAFSAVYGGAVQMFGRAYRGGPSQVLADRMKAAQQLVYGEQLGWLDPRIVDSKERFPFFKEMVQTRYRYRDHFYKGEMIRPPRFLDEIPTVTADWQWSGETIITTDAVLAGGWRKTDENGKTVSAVWFFVNVSDKPITSRVAVRLDEIGLEDKKAAFEKPLTFEPGKALVMEIVR